MGDPWLFLPFFINNYTEPFVRVPYSHIFVVKECSLIILIKWSILNNCFIQMSKYTPKISWSNSLGADIWPEFDHELSSHATKRFNGKTVHKIKIQNMQVIHLWMDICYLPSEVNLSTGITLIWWHRCFTSIYWYVF